MMLLGSNITHGQWDIVLELGKFRFGDLKVYEFEEEDDIEDEFKGLWILTKGSFGIDVRFRDNFGQFVHAYSWWFQFEASTAETEATTLHVAMRKLRLIVNVSLWWMQYLLGALTETNIECFYLVVDICSPQMLDSFHISNCYYMATWWLLNNMIRINELNQVVCEFKKRFALNLNWASK